MAEEPDSSENCKVRDLVGLLKLSLGKIIGPEPLPWEHGGGGQHGGYLSGQREARQLLHGGGLSVVSGEEHLPAI